MAVLRAIHASSLPDPGDGAPAGVRTGARARRAPAAARARRSHPDRFRRRHRRGRGRRSARARGPAQAQCPHRLLRAGRNRVLRQPPPLRDTIAELAAALRAITGRPWQLSVVDAEGEPTIGEAELAIVQARHDDARGHPGAAAAFHAFPEAELIDPPAAKRSFT
ncbi:hypothetical protein AB5I41_06755 [Sphingomonas sp. MMS24-JH45]